LGVHIVSSGSCDFRKTHFADKDVFFPVPAAEVFRNAMGLVLRQRLREYVRGQTRAI
jgi:hypothetical protein